MDKHPRAPSAARSTVPRNYVLAWIGQRVLPLVCCVSLVSLGLAFVGHRFVSRQPLIVRLSAGPELTRRQAIASTIGDEARNHQLTIDIVASKGPEDCLELLKAGKLDAAIINSAVMVPDDDQIAILGVLQTEAVHMLVKAELADGRPLVDVVRGKRVNFGQPGSTERLLAEEFCKFARLKQPTPAALGDVLPTYLGRSELLEKALAIASATGQHKAALAAELPDCVPVVESLPSQLVQLLVEAGGYDVVSMPATRAFLMDNLQLVAADKAVIQREFLEPAVIPSHCYFGHRPIPTSDLETVGMRLVVVARRDLPASVVRPLMTTIFEGKCAHRLKPISPRDLATPYLIHRAAAAYFDRDKPLLVQSQLERISQGLSFCGAFGAGALSLYGLWRSQRWRKPIDYFAEIRKVETALNAVSASERDDVRCQQIQETSQSLAKLRHELVEDICAGRIKGDQAILNILLLIKDVRRTVAETNLALPSSHTSPVSSTLPFGKAA